MASGAKAGPARCHELACFCAPLSHWCRKSDSQLGHDLLDLSVDSVAAHLLADLLHAEPLATVLALLERVLLDEDGTGLDNSTGDLGSCSLLGLGRVLSDGGVGGLVEIAEGFASESLGPLGELFLEAGRVVSFKIVIVGLNVATEDVLEVSLGIGASLGLGLLLLSTALLAANILLGLLPAEAREAVVVMGHVEATITGTLHGSENSVTGGGADKTNIKVGLEGSAGLVGNSDSAILLLLFLETGTLLIGHLVQVFLDSSDVVKLTISLSLTDEVAH